MSDPKVGDPVTHLVRLNDDLLAVHGRVTEILSYAEHYGIRIEDRFGTAARNALSEGVYWVRGHHREDSDEVQALRAAYALRNT